MGVDPDLFFPERGASTREAKEVCRGCVVREDCLEYALANGEKFGIWGGLSERERRRLRRARAMSRRAAAAAALRLLIGRRSAPLEVVRAGPRGFVRGRCRAQLVAPTAPLRPPRRGPGPRARPGPRRSRPRSPGAPRRHRPSPGPTASGSTRLHDTWVSPATASPSARTAGLANGRSDGPGHGGVGCGQPHVVGHQHVARPHGAGPGARMGLGRPAVGGEPGEGGPAHLGEGALGAVEEAGQAQRGRRPLGEVPARLEGGGEPGLEGQRRARRAPAARRAPRRAHPDAGARRRGGPDRCARPWPGPRPGRRSSRSRRRPG